MKNLKKKLLVILAAATIFTGCAKNEEKNISDSKKIKVGIIELQSHIALDRAREGFLKGLEESGYEIDENTVNVEGDISLVPQAAKSMEQKNVDLIYAIATPAAQGAKGVVEKTPIVFNAVTDPVSADLVENNERPNVNVTGVSDYFPVKTQLENFLKIFPSTKRLGVLYSTGEANSESQIEELRKVTKELNIELVEKSVTNTNEVSQAMDSLAKNIDAYIGIQDNLASSSAALISNKLIENKIPSLAGERGPVENGLLMADGIDYFELGKKASKIAIEIKNGKEAKDIPVVFEKENKRTVNEKAAKELGVFSNKELIDGSELVN